MWVRTNHSLLGFLTGMVLRTCFTPAADWKSCDNVSRATSNGSGIWELFVAGFEFPIPADSFIDTVEFDNATSPKTYMEFCCGALTNWGVHHTERTDPATRVLVSKRVALRNTRSCFQT